MTEFLTLLMLLQTVPTAPTIDEPEALEMREETPDPVTGEFLVDPYTQSNENAGAKPFANPLMAEKFGGPTGIRKITDRLVAISVEDPRISDIFKAQDLVRLRRTLFEQFCYILDAGCTYSGRDMSTAHADMGVERSDLNALVENLQAAMREADVPFAAQNRLLAKLAPMDRDIVQK